MFAFRSLVLFVFVFSGCAQKQLSDLGKDDPRLWLEEVEGQKALGWVKEENSKTLSALTSTARFKKAKAKAAKIYQSKDNIPKLKMRGDYLYTFWQDSKHVRGQWRRVLAKKFRGKKTSWQVLFDLDKIAKSEGENWVYKEAICNAPAYDRCMISLSRGGKDAAVLREFDVASKKFVKDGFVVPESKSWAQWLDKDHLMLATNYGQGSMTIAGYPRLLKNWARGTDLKKAKLVFEADKKHMTVIANSIGHSGEKLTLVRDWQTYFSSKRYLYTAGKLAPLVIPDTADVAGLFKGHLIFELRKDWEAAGQTFKGGSLLALKTSALTGSSPKATDLILIMAPDMKSSNLELALLKDRILINRLVNVKGQIFETRFESNGFAKPQAMNLLKGQYHLRLAAGGTKSNQFLFSNQSFLTPKTLFSYNPKTNKRRLLQSMPQQFNSKGMKMEQRWATSKDGTQVPYFLVGKSSALKKGNAPTLLYGYGGFEVSRMPNYTPVVGKLWLEQGGVYVVGNIRGGGEFGPRWHQAALKKKRHKAYDDFIAVGEDLIATGVTSKEKLAIEGGSNGGLLVGAVMTRRPDLFKSVVCLVPLLDMVRYTQLLAGASWMGEYGEPLKNDMREYIKTYSPYQNVSAEKKYPHVFFMTSTKDDRVHPGHARKMAHKMMEQGHANVRYFENTEGGHAASSNLKQKARREALIFEFLNQTLL